MKREQFIETRGERWKRLEALTSRAGHGGPGALTASELLELGTLYRRATSDLAIARRDFPGDLAVHYINGLVARAHPIIYREETGGWKAVGRWVRYGFPQAYREIAGYTLFAFSVFLVAAIVSWVLVAHDDRAADVLLPGTAQQLRAIMDQHRLWVNTPGESHSVVANYIMLNNIQVAFIAFAGGILLGILTTWVMVTNGIMLGAIGAMVAHRGLSAPFWSFVFPHGVVELSVIFMAGGAGLSLGDAILRPGSRLRKDALVASSRRAILVVFASIPLLAVAGTIEGFLSPSDAPVAVKIAVGLVTGTALYAYVFLSRPTIDREQYTLRDVLHVGPGGTQSDARALTSR
jgi:uncharacterized membrane protein SpoIIM required for sporulation